MSNADQPYHLFILKREFERRKERRASLSMRGFARQLDIDPSSVSRLFKQKSYMTVNVAALVLTKFELTGEERKRFIESFAQERWTKTVAYLEEICGLVGDSINNIDETPT